MFTYFNHHEFEIAAKLVGIAFEHSAKAFADFIQKPVAINAMSPKESDMLPTTNVGNPVYMMVSELKGELRGKCYLNFSHKDARLLSHACLPKNYHEDAAMFEAILMELDNILTAAVVTMMSDILKINAYAYVPELKIVSAGELNKLLEYDFNSDKLVLDFKTEFKVAELGLSSEFIWVMDLTLADAISRFAMKEDHHTILNKYKKSNSSISIQSN